MTIPGSSWTESVPRSATTFTSAAADWSKQVIEQLESTQVVLVSGAAGSGKSGIAKDAIGILAADHFAFVFRAEEFASPISTKRCSETKSRRSAACSGRYLAGQGRKVLLIESVERLLEAVHPRCLHRSFDARGKRQELAASS